MSESNVYRILIVDDEQPARQRLRELIDHDRDVREIIEVENGLDAVEAILQKQPDVVFLDVQMPGLDGLGVIDTLGIERMPVTIFVTAFDQHAVRAFEAAATDYVLKPYGDERMEAAFSRAKARLDAENLRAFGQSMLKLLDGRRRETLFSIASSYASGTRPIWSASTRLIASKARACMSRYTLVANV
jgi:two-component system LytT family response regulator